MCRRRANSSRSCCRYWQAFFEHGGGVIDTSPMYGHAEAVLGKLLRAAPDDRKRLFAATKVWTWGRDAGVQQMQESIRLTGIDRFDLIQIHNLRDGRCTSKPCGNG